MSNILFAVVVFVGVVVVLRVVKPKTKKRGEWHREIGYIPPNGTDPKVLDSAWVIQAEKELIRKQLRGEVKWKQ